LERTDLFGHIIYNHAMGLEQHDPGELDTALAEIMNGLSLAARYAQSDAQRAYLDAERAEFSNDWSSIPAKLVIAFQSDECYAVNWVSTLAGIFGQAELAAAHYERMMRCDPLSSIYVSMGSQFLLWAGQAERAVAISDQFLKTVEYNAWVDDMRFVALLATGKYRDYPGISDTSPDGSFFETPRKFYVHTLENELAKAREVLDATNGNRPMSDVGLLLAEAMLGNREAANTYAARVDARFGGPFILAEAIKGCFCGAPFDLEATPNFRKGIEQAGFNWPPASPIRFPAKDW
jgi:adenylate cyclase